MIDQVLWTLGRPDWVSVMGNPDEPGGWQRMIRMKWAGGLVGELDGSNLWGYDDHPLRLMIVGDRSYGEARGLDGWYRRCKSGSWPTEVEELWEVEKGVQEYQESFGRMANGVVEALSAGRPFPADGEAAWDELVFEAAVHRSALSGGDEVRLADVEAAAMTAPSS